MQVTPRPSKSPLFPYTTLFRSVEGEGRRPGILPGDPAEEDRHEVGHHLLLLRLLRVGRGRLQAGGEEHTHQVEQRSEEHTSELQSLRHLVCRLLLEKKNNACCR